jgi:uncharacterized protein YciI
MREYRDRVPVFALRMVYGENWDHAKGRREQKLWDEHAAVMDELVDQGFLILGGPIGDGTDTMLIVRAADEHEVRATLAADPWEPARMLKIGSLEPWTIWLDGVKHWSQPGS